MSEPKGHRKYQFRVVLDLTFAPAYRRARKANAKSTTLAGASSHATMPLLAANRKDTGWQIDWRDYPGHATAPQKAFSMAVSWPMATAQSRNRGHIAS
jgi:hypothetical protein